MWSSMRATVVDDRIRRVRRVGIGAALLLIVATAGASTPTSPSPARELIVDSAASKVYFDIGVLVVLRKSGTFSGLEGAIGVDSAAGQANISIRIPAKSAHMKDPEHTQLLLSPDFFDARTHPWIEFRSTAMPLTSSKARRIKGTLTIRGVERPVTFAVSADACLDEPGLRQCQVRVEGSIKRSAFGMVEFKRTLGDTVHLRIEVVLKPEAVKVAKAKRPAPKQEISPRARRK